jgi:tRNA-splicing ligase RtcB
MDNSKLKGKDLDKINYITDKARSLAIGLMKKYFKHISKQEKLVILEKVKSDPEAYLENNVLSQLAAEFVVRKDIPTGINYELKPVPGDFHIYGKQFITGDTIRQMETAMRLPIAARGALMPDAHSGYGLPIGGVLAVENAVIPYGVGLDIGCRMSLSIYDIPTDFLKHHQHKIKTALQEQTHFGIGKKQDTYEDHEVLDRREFYEIETLRNLHGKAKSQIGTSGSGNHFVEVGIVQLGDNNATGIPGGAYIGILAHSGSRGFGAAVAKHYTGIALEKCWLPKGAKHLAWLDLDSEAGQEYWIAMNLAGDYARACHDVIHRKMGKALGIKQIARIENHHNFAWKEKQADGTELIVHRKGATPAQKHELGIIPANMCDPGYIVSGKGNELALNSASHGAGRKMSRKQAKASFTLSELKKKLRQLGITLIDGALDESPMAYKNMEDVMHSQRKLVNIEGKFFPKVVRMDKG